MASEKVREVLLSPSDFPIGSPESRAAARAMLEHAEAGRKRIEFVTNTWFACHGDGPEPPDWTKAWATDWRLQLDGSLFRMVYVPTGTEWPLGDSQLSASIPGRRGRE